MLLVVSFLQFKSEFCNKDFMILATVSPWYCFCWLYRASSSLAANNRINLILLSTERLHFHFSLPCFGEGNGNPLQCSCLENLRDGGAWWAAVYGVAQSQTWLKQLSSSSYVWRVNNNLTGLQNSYLWDEEIHTKTERCFPFSNCLSQFLAQRSSLLATALLLFSPFTLLWEHYPFPKL